MRPALAAACFLLCARPALALGPSFARASSSVTPAAENVCQLAKVLACARRTTASDVAWWLWDYGCHCGKGGLADVKPVDAIDSCCYVHDRCYESIPKWPCLGAAYAVVYRYECVDPTGPRPTAVCLANSWWRTLPWPPQCADDACRCDAAMAACVAGETLHTPYRHYDQSKCKPAMV